MWQHLALDLRRDLTNGLVGHPLIFREGIAVSARHFLPQRLLVGVHHLLPASSEPIQVLIERLVLTARLGLDLLDLLLNPGY